MADRTFVGFGFGAIQAGLFMYEAHRSGNFTRLVAAEVVPATVDAVRRRGGYCINIATLRGIEKAEIPGVEIYNPEIASERDELVKAVTSASEIATALPSVSFYGEGSVTDVAGIIAGGLGAKIADPSAPGAVIYTAENHNHAAEILQDILSRRIGESQGRYQCLNTVIGKMSGVVRISVDGADRALSPLSPGLDKAFLVEEFNRILVTRITMPGFSRGIAVFEEKDDLLPFEEAKLYGHNATHALIGYLLKLRKARFMSDAITEKGLLKLAREAFVEESGEALCRRYPGIDPLFTKAGFAAYADNLLTRMMNPHLHDAVDRITRDPRRKLGWNDRLVGTMRLAIEEGVNPQKYAMGAAAAACVLSMEESRPAHELLPEIWRQEGARDPEIETVMGLVRTAGQSLNGKCQQL